jgi:S1-C subfamily serine protease
MRLSYKKIIGAIAILVLATISCGIFTDTQTRTLPQVTSSPFVLPTENDSASSYPVVDLVDQQDQLVKLYKEVNPGVVAIRVLSEEGSSLGSGFVIDEDGHILTNFHVVQGATELEIDFPSGYKTRGTILGTDLDSDIAIIKVDVPKDELVPLSFGDSDALQVGQTVVAIGNPHGYESSMTTGIISSLGRTMQSLHEAPGGGSFTAGDIIQTDAAINPGNSGGPLLNLNGEVIGVNVAIETTTFDLSGQPVNSGIGFAISINIIKRVVPYLIE